MDDKTVERSLDASIKDVAAYGMMVGLGETYLSACALHLGASNVLLGLLGSLPIFLGACLQPLAANLVDRIGRRRGLYLFGATLQAAMWIPILASIFLPRPLGLWVLVGSVIVYFGGVHFASPPWNSTMGDLVPAGIRGRYFGKRNAVMMVCTCIAAVLAGGGLHLAAGERHTSWGYVAIFTGALVARAASVWYLSKMAEPSYHRTPGDSFTLWQFLRQLPTSNFAKFVFFIAAMNFAAHVSGVYFIAYFMRELKFTYFELMVSQTVLILSQFPALYFWGPIADRYGNRKVMIVAGFGIVALPALWLLSRDVWWAWFLQVWAGTFWCGFNLSAANFLLDAVSPPKRARCTAYFNLIVGCAVLASGLIGASMVGHLPKRLPLLDVRLWSGFYILLILSFLLRLLAMVIFLPRIREVRDVPNIGVGEMLFRATPLKSIAEAAGDLITNVRRGGSQSGREPDRED